MRCPFCYFEETKVIDSRTGEDGVRRRRECLATGCGRRFTTYEKVQLAGAHVIKKDGRREEFSREKLLSGLRRACEKRPLPASAIEGLADYVEAAVNSHGVAEVPSTYVGELVMERLRQLDEIAYIRFASVYRSFADVEDLREALAALENAAPVGRPTPPSANQLPLLPQDELASLSGRSREVAKKLVRKSGRGRPSEPPQLKRARG
ncbi:MAG: transcriptional regulator NrdR [Dehalococcoidia bacterium]